MSFFIRSNAKINISLRVAGKRTDGYHELRSLFFLLSSMESLTITPQYDHNVNDIVEVSGENVPGRNILEDVIALAGKRADIPALRIRLEKSIPPGSGMGGGSGNAAALVYWINSMWSDLTIRGEEIGSDVPFFLCGSSWAIVRGRGEKVFPLFSPPPSPKVLVAVPEWQTPTGEAYSLLDTFRGGEYPLSEKGAEAEIDSLIARLRDEKNVGLLPNDFAPVLLKAHPEYERVFDFFKASGAFGWGITGSGSAAFGLFSKSMNLSDSFREMSGLKWIRKIFCVE